MSKLIFENIHLLQTLVDKRLSFNIRQELAENLPEPAVTALRETLYNVAVGNVKGFPPNTKNLLSSHRLLIFEIVDQTEDLSDSERESLIASEKVLKFLEKVLPPILKVLLASKGDERESEEDDE